MENSGCVNPVLPSRSHYTVYVATKCGHGSSFFTKHQLTHTCQENLLPSHHLNVVLLQGWRLLAGSQQAGAMGLPAPPRPLLLVRGLELWQPLSLETQSCVKRGPSPANEGEPSNPPPDDAVKRVT